MSLDNEQSRRAFRWPIFDEATIDAPARRVWKTIASADSLVAAHPFLHSNPIESWSGAESRDEVHYLNDVVYRREFRDWQEGTGFDLEIHHRNKALAWVSWRVEAIDDDTASLRITVFPYALQHLPPAIRWAPHLFMLRPRLRAYLSSVVRGFEWYIEKGDPVPRNQFGAHPWFST